MDRPDILIQYRFFEDNPNVVKECQGWTKWEDITEPGKLAEIRQYIFDGYKYQIRTLTQTHTDGLELIYCCMAPNKVNRPVLEEQIVPSLDGIRQYLVRHNIISGSSDELGFKLMLGETAGRFWKNCTFVTVRGEYMLQLGVEYGKLVSLLDLYTSMRWRDELSTILVERLEEQ
ncbi:hypothetical protein [Burkholderia phage FLC9]|nr:hypothetical protein [Burkholderia phage FLC9]